LTRQASFLELLPLMNQLAEPPAKPMPAPAAPVY
jgi:hypothetical protein